MGKCNELVGFYPIAWWILLVSWSGFLYLHRVGHGLTSPSSKYYNERDLVIKLCCNEGKKNIYHNIDLNDC